MKNPQQPKSYRSLAIVCLASAFIGFAATWVPMQFRISRLVGEVARLTNSHNSEWADAFMTAIRLSTSGKLKIVNQSEPWVLNNASVHDCVIIGAPVWNLGTNSSINNSEIIGTPTEFRNAASAKIDRLWTR